MTDDQIEIIMELQRLANATIAKRDARIAELEALILDVYADLCRQYSHDDKIGFDKLDAEVNRIKARKTPKEKDG
jgi:hypothetical protein